MAPKRRVSAAFETKPAKSARLSGSQRPNRNVPDSLGLPGLPVELLDAIAKHLTLPDVCTIRILCKELAGKMFGAYVNAFFTDRSFLLSDRTSMQVLSEMSKNEAFTKHIRGLCFSTDMLREPIVLHHVLRMSNGSRSGRISALNAKRLYADLKRDEATFYEKDLANVLETILGNLRKAGKFIDIRFHDTSSPSSFGWAFGRRKWRVKKIFRPLLAFTCNNILMETQHPEYHNAVCKALMRMQYPVRRLDIGKHGSFDEENVLSWYTSHVTNIPASNLRTLKAEIHMYDPEDDRPASALVHTPTRQKHIRDLTSFLARAPNLEHLALALGPGNDRLDGLRPDTNQHFADVFHAIATKTHLDGSPMEVPCDGKLLSKLKTLDLRSHMIPFDLLLIFCTERKETLKELRLRLVTDGKEQAHVADRIFEAVGARTNDGFSVFLKACYFDSNKTMEDALMEPERCTDFHR